MNVHVPKYLVAVLLASGCLAAPTIASAAAPIEVNSTADLADSDITDGICDAGKGACTLRAAVETANANSGADTILLPAADDPYALSLSGAEPSGDPAGAGDLDITGDVTITGDGQDTTVIEASDLNNRIFDVHSGATAAISGVTMENGTAPSDDTVDTGDRVVGGGIRVLGRLTLTDSTLTGNTADYGGGAATDAEGAQMTLRGVTVKDNGTDFSTSGGGIAQLIGSVTILNSTITANHGSFGAGIENEAPAGPDGTMTITDSLVADNIGTPFVASTRQSTPGGFGGGLVLSGPPLGAGGDVTLTRTEVRGNEAAQGGGLVEDGGGTLAVIDSWIHDNTASLTRRNDGGGGGIYADGGGTVTVTRSTLSANQADLQGGAILDQGGDTISVANSTITGNTAGSSTRTGNGAGISLEGGADGTLALESSTIHDNAIITATPISAPTRGFAQPVVEVDNCSTTPECGFDQTPDPETVTSHATIIASAGPACGGPITSNGNNLNGDDTCSFHAAGDKVNTDPLLGALAANGGPASGPGGASPMLTMALLTGSPAIDAAGTAGCPSTDQRGVTRPQGPACDIGAYEVAVPPAVVVPARPATSAPSVTPPKKTVPKKCASRRHFRIRVRKRHGIKLVSATVLVNGKRVMVLRGKRLRAPVDLRKLPKGTFTVSITARTSRGRVIRAHRTYHTCIPRLPRHKLPAL